jgi:hypothetical protein
LKSRDTAKPALLSAAGVREDICAIRVTRGQILFGFRISLVLGAWSFYSGGSRLHQYTIASTAPTITKGPDEGSGTGIVEAEAIWPKAEFPRTNRTRNARTHPTPLGRANLPQIRGDCMPFWEHSACRGEPAPGVERNGALSRNGRPALSYFGTPEKPENLTWRSQKQKQRSTADYPDFADALSEVRL